MGFNMKDLQQDAGQLMKMQEDLQNSTFEGTSGGGAVTITINWQVSSHCRQAATRGGGSRRRQHARRFDPHRLSRRLREGG